jgi:predicted small secreted protein
MMKKISAILIALAAVILVQAAPPSDTCDQETWVTNGRVLAIVTAGNKVYIGGVFSQVGPYTGGGVPIDSSTGMPASVFPKIDRTVYAVCADGNGGWFVGGSFAFVDGIARNNIAHILSNGKVDLNWDPNANSTVQSLAVSGTTVYAGGSFTNIGGQTRKYFVALDATTGNATALDLQPNSTVNAIAVSGTTVYIGGNFIALGGATRNHIAAFDASTGLVRGWNPNIYLGAVYSIAVSGANVYLGGAFTSIGGFIRNHIASVDGPTGLVNSWNPGANKIVHSLAVSGAMVYAGGEFDTIGGQSRNYIAAIDTLNGNATAWNPNAGAIVYSLVVSGTTVYAGGEFTSIGGQSRNHIAALDLATGNATTWDPRAENIVLSLAVSGTTVYAGGAFIGIGGQNRNNIAALDATSGIATSWNPNANRGVVLALAVRDNSIYVGGAFTTIGDSSRNNIACLDTTTGKATSWNPNANSDVNTLDVSGPIVYAGGRFTSIGDSSRNYIAALDATTGNATAWNPNANYFVGTLVVRGTTVYAGGQFSSISGQLHNYIAALDATTGNATAWNPSANSGVLSLAVSGTTVYAGGQFTSINGQVRNYIAALDTATGMVKTWNPNADAIVYSLAVSGATVYAGGAFTRIGSIGGQSRNYIAVLDATTGEATAWNPNASSGVLSLAVSGTTVYAGGAFNSIGKGAGHSYFAQFGVYYPAPVVQSISPSAGVINSTVQITNLSGSNFRSGATVKLVKAGQTDINATNVSVVSSMQITCTINITNAPSGVWDVVVTNDDLKSGTLIRGFTITIPPPVLVSPANNATDMGLTPTLTWHKASNDSLYTLQLSASSTFSIRIINDNMITDTAVSVPPALLANNTPYYWKVAITKKGGEVTAFSAPWTFTTIVAVPGTPILASPSSSATNQPLSMSLSWNASTGASTYRVQLSTNASFSDTLVDDSTLTLLTKAIGPLFTSATYFWRVNAKNAGGTSAWSSVWSFTTIPPAPAVPTLSSPANSATNQPLSTSLAWNAVSGASTYHVQMSTSAAFSDTVADDSTLTVPSKSIAPLSTSKTFYWRINAKNPGGTSAWSSVWSFTTIPPVAGAPVPLSPSNSAQNQLISLTLSWNAVTGAVTYRTQVASDTGFTSIVNDDSSLTAPSKAIGPLSTGTTYYWRVNAKNPGGTSAWSEKWCFTTIPPAPGIATLISPNDATGNVSVNPVMTWNHVSGAATYRLQIGADSLFNTIIMQDSTLTDTSKTCAALNNDTKYFWRVNATNAGGTGAWSSARRFTIIVALPSVVTLKTPATGDTVKSDSVFLAWSAGTPKVDRYSVEYASDSSFTSPAVDTAVSDTVKLIRSLRNNTAVWWKVKAHNAAGWGDWSFKNVFAIKLISTYAGMRAIPKAFSFNITSRTGSIRYALPKAEHVFLRIYSMNGQLQSESVNMQQAAGYYTVNLQRSLAAAGSYLMVFRAGEYYQKKMVFLVR